MWHTWLSGLIICMIYLLFFFINAASHHLAIIIQKSLDKYTIILQVVHYNEPYD